MKHLFNNKQRGFCVACAAGLWLTALAACSGDEEGVLDVGQGPQPEDITPYVTQVFDYLPAVGQFTNTMPAYEEGDTQEDMNRKVLRPSATTTGVW